MKKTLTNILGSVAVLGGLALSGCGKGEIGRSSDLALVNSVFRKASGEDRVLEEVEKARLIEDLGAKNYTMRANEEIDIKLGDFAEDQFILYGLKNREYSHIKSISRRDLLNYLESNK